MLVVSEVSEALDVLREDTALVNTEAFREELADIIIRTLDIGAFVGVNVMAGVLEKHVKNLARPHRQGKRF